MAELLRRAWALDPAVLADLGRVVPGWLGWVLLAAGLGFALFGAHPALLRFTSAALAAAIGWFTAALVLDAQALGISAALLSWSAAAALGLLAAAWPVAAGCVIGGFAGGRFFAQWVPIDDPFLRALPGAIACGSLAGLFVRAAAALASAFVGAAAVAVGAGAVLVQTGRAGWLDRYPVVTLLPLSLVFVSCAAFQLTRRPPPRAAKPRGAQQRLPNEEAA